MNGTNTIDNAARVAGRKLVARNPKTGRYFDGTNFDNIESNALALRPGTTAEHFRLSWSGPVEVIEIGAPLEAAQEKPSYALRIHRGEFDKYGAAKTYIHENGGVSKTGKSYKSYSVRVAAGKYVSRKINVPATSRPGQSEAWISYHSNQCAVVWSGGELATDWA